MHAGTVTLEYEQESRLVYPRCFEQRDLWVFLLQFGCKVLEELLRSAEGTDVTHIERLGRVKEGDEVANAKQPQPRFYLLKSVLL